MKLFKQIPPYFLFALLLVTAVSYSVNTVANNVVSKKHTHTYTGKPHAAIEMRYEFNQKEAIEVGQPLQYDINFIPTRDADDLQVSYQTKSDLLIQNSNMSVNFGEQRKGQGNALQLKVIPQQQGLFYIYLSATLSVNGKQQSRSFAIAVKVGDQSAEALFKMKSLPQGVVTQQGETKIISMPAIETTR